MLKHLKEKLNQQYKDMWQTDWVEFIGAPIVALLIFVFRYLFFALAKNMNSQHKIQEEIENQIKTDYRNGEFPDNEEADEDDGLDFPADEGEDDGLGTNGEPY